MIEALIVILIVGLVLFLVYFIAGKFVQGTPLNIIGAILALIFVLYALQRVGLFGSLRF
jgi:hypothetical protein